MPAMLLGGIVINEILADPNGPNYDFDTDGNGRARAVDEFVELYNASSSPIDISGLQLWDKGRGNWFTFPPGTVLQPGAHAMVITRVQNGGSLPTGGPNDLFFDAQSSGPVINNGGDNVVVYDPTNNEYIQAVFNGDAVDDPPNDYAGFPSSPPPTRVGPVEDFGHDTDGQSLQREGDGSDVIVSATPTPGTTNICFTNGTLLAGPEGEVPVEQLAPGSRLLTADHGVQTVRWVHALKLSHAELLADPARRPVLIPAGALGAARPHRDLRVSQQHRILVCGPIVRRMFGQAEILIPARALLPLRGVALCTPPGGVTYHHVLLDNHEILFANGIAAESLLLGPMAQASLPQQALAELEALFGGAQAGLGPTAPARPLVGARRGRRLIARHVKNGKAICQLPLADRLAA